MPTYRPRWAATLHVPQREEHEVVLTTELPVNVVEFTWIQNDHNQADELELVMDWAGFGIDPRFIRHAVVEFWLDNANEFGGWAPSVSGGRSDRGNTRFIGTIVDVERNSEEGAPYTVRVRALDYTDYFLRAKPFGTSGIPDYSQRLDEAWRRIVSQTPGAAVLANRLERRGFDSWPLLSDAVPARLRGKGQIPVQQRTDAWGVWQKCMEMTSLISFVELDRVIVTTPDAYYRDNDPPVLAWGANTYRLREARNEAFSDGVLLSCFDPFSGRVVEAHWPPLRQKRLRRRLTNATAPGDNPKAEFADQYTHYPIAQAMEYGRLLDLAKRVYSERSKQEYQGELLTHEFLTSTENGEPFHLLDLRIGDRIRVNANSNENDALLRLTERERIDHLIARGYQPAAAAIIADYASDPALLDTRFHVKGITCNGSADDEGGNFEMTVQYCNKILINGEGA